MEKMNQVILEYLLKTIHHYFKNISNKCMWKYPTGITLYRNILSMDFINYHASARIQDHFKLFVTFLYVPIL